MLDGATTLSISSTQGYMDAIKVLLRAKADPQFQQNTSGNLFVPLDILATRGDSDAVRELIRHVGIEGCGGPSRGVNALVTAARDKHVDNMVLLTDAGVVDKGGALIAAADYKRRRILQAPAATAGADKCREKSLCYKAPGLFGATPLLWSIQACRPCSSRIARLLVDAGADTTSTVTMGDVQAFGLMAYTPIEIAMRRIRRKKIDLTVEYPGYRSFSYKCCAYLASQMHIWPVNDVLIGETATSNLLISESGGSVVICTLPTTTKQSRLTVAQASRLLAMFSV